MIELEPEAGPIQNLVVVIHRATPMLPCLSLPAGICKELADSLNDTETFTYIAIADDA
jgi:hypothetical protein